MGRSLAPHHGADSMYLAAKGCVSMKAKALSWWESIHTSFWFLPTLIALAAVGLALGIVWVDRSISLEAKRLGDLFYPGGPEGAREVLSTIAGSTITVAGVTFSITIVALTTAGAQFGPRLLRSFMADKGNQLVLGTFVGTFIYCLLVLRTIRDGDNGEFVPKIAVTLGIVLALASFAVLIYFFHHASSAIQAEQVVDTIFRELVGEIEHTFPAEQEPPEASEKPPELASLFGPGKPTRTVTANASGYLRTVAVEDLISLAREHDLVLRLEYRSGDFVFEGTPLAVVAGAGGSDDHVDKQVRQAFVLGKYRSLEQDVEFPIQQLVDMALRALSPSLNDPYTAVNCIDRLGAALCHLNGRHAPSPYQYDEDGALRVILDVPTYAGILDAAFNQIRQNAQRSLSVSIRLLEALQAIAVTVTRDAQRDTVQLHAEMVYRTGQEAAHERKDRDDLEARFQAVIQKLRPPGP
jgi:uncharacterized membrane protein